MRSTGLQIAAWPDGTVVYRGLDPESSDEYFSYTLKPDELEQVLLATTAAYEAWPRDMDAYFADTRDGPVRMFIALDTDRSVSWRWDQIYSGIHLTRFDGDHSASRFFGQWTLLRMHCHRIAVLSSRQGARLANDSPYFPWRHWVYCADRMPDSN
jgi:hypothetical protein